MISLGDLTRWLCSQAESLGVDVFPGFAASCPVVDDLNRVRGVQIAESGVAKNGSKKASYVPGVHLLAKQTILSEGCRGSVSEDVIHKYGLRQAVGASPQAYGLGIKEVWELPAGVLSPGKVMHSVGYPLGFKNYGYALFIPFLGGDLNDVRLQISFNASTS